MHAALAASMSKELNALINGSLVEARTGVVTWADVDVATFVQFSQFAYTGDYHVQDTPTSRFAQGLASEKEA